ncbi:MAG TPA: hypothetical protein VG498_11805, partial [Terriglobales bacterium]|nr:hypothetical protein [Terriglobales bacterium]
MLKLFPDFSQNVSKRNASTAAALRLLSLMCASQLALAQLTTAQYDNARTGANPKEAILTPQNVNTNRFGKVFTIKVDGDLYAQPLYLPQLPIPGKGKHNVMFLATEHDSVYAFDADAAGDPLWRVNFTNPASGITTIPAREVRCPFIRPEVGITPTPVIDQQSGTVYVLARTKESGAYVQKLHALDVLTGAEKSGSPVAIKASFPRKVMGVFNGAVTFDALRENPRAALL